MQPLPTDLLSEACKIFLSLAYPADEASIPPNRHGYLQWPPAQDLNDPQVQAQLPRGTFQFVKDEAGAVRGYALRLGCAAFPHLKMKVQEVFHQGQPVWVFSVDTHDAFSRDNARPPADHPDAPAWMKMQQANAELKQQIERAWAADNILTFNGLLRRDLEQSPEAKG